MNIRSIVKKFIPKNLFAAIEPYGHLAEAIIFNTLNGFPARGLKVVGVTGTNGKTTTCFLIHKMLHEAGHKVGLMTTVGYGVGNDITPQIHHMTNVSVPELMKRLKWMKSQGIEWLVLETTSHGLAQNRVWGVPFSIAVITNVTHEHLAYHRTFERYRDAKRKLFKLTNRNKRGLRTGIVNADDPSADLFVSDIEHPITYGIDKGAIKATDINLSASGVSYRTALEDEIYHINCQISGRVNVYNSLAALCAGHAIGLTRQQIEHGIKALEGVEGRMTNIDTGQDFTVIVDYAHTPDSFEKLFKDMRPVAEQKMIVLFGSLGQGDKPKRELQGKLAGRYADEVIVCEEDDRQEDGHAIMEAIAAGAESEGKLRNKNLFLVHDRPEAINFAVRRASKGDMVLLLGKGHEKTIEHADGEHPWNEADMARQALENLKGA
ncbi:MAG TPA: UDP-N-acetylmuramyl-tripeptide synthetase [Candidatus Saccharimonadales bacterium]|nr:UDP-N-acetylmuramyl-tripeptide synthetase [Candidatus Saccharimonadales bacterium]